MSPAPTENTGPLQSMRRNFNLLLFVARTWATSLEVFLHRDIGERYLGWNAAAVFALVPLYLLGWEHYDPRGMLFFLAAYMGMCLVARIGAIRRSWRGEASHSYYTGWPRFLGPRAKISELKMKRLYEPVGLVVIGWTFREYDPPLGTYLMLGAACLVLSAFASETMQRIRNMDLNDAVIEQELTAERFRRTRGEG